MRVPGPDQALRLPLPNAIIFGCVRPGFELWSAWKEIMPTDIIMPQMGESIVEGTITKWLKKPGDKVQRDEPLFEISTDKVDAEIPAPASGVLQEIKVAEGTTVGVNTVVGTIAVDGEAAAAPAKSSAAKPAAAKPEEAKPRRKKGRREKSHPSPQPAPSSAPAAQEDEEETRSSPLVRKIAREHGVSLAKVSGTGLGGRITKQDILSFIDNQSSAPATTPAQTSTSSAPSSSCACTRDIAPNHAARCRTLPRRSRAHDEHAQADRQAHDRVAPHQRSRSLHVRSGFHSHRESA